eukprot:Phypoly_transcript_06505.p1 GENE.Phypoly_transcript_06505~~Phypoly_transcript_06505.p1  ORF type:complete len:544 (+),score=156.32 Phypoly_transcript_06505:217-1632(+)
MKQVNWAKLNYVQAESTIWSKLDDAHVDLDVDLVEMMFGAKVAVKADNTSNIQKATTITLIDPKKANNCSIMLSKFKMFTFRQLQEAIYTIDESILDEESATSILQFAPSKEDVEAIQAYQGDPRLLGKAEQFYIEILKVPRLVPRLRVINFKLSFYKILNDIRPDVDAVLKATEELQESKKLYKLFEYILAVGNYLNGNSTRGGAFGFKMDSLAKLKDTKSNDPMVPSMLHFIAHIVDTKDPDVLDFAKDISHVEHAAKVNTAVVLSQVSSLRKGIEEAEREATAAPMSTEQDPFKNVINSFLISAKSDFREVDEKITKMEAAFKVVAKLYGEPNAKPEELFNIFNNFTDSLMRARAENIQKKEAAAKAAAKKKAAMEAALAKKEGRVIERDKSERSFQKKPLTPRDAIEEELFNARAEQHARLGASGGASAAEDAAAQQDAKERGGMDNMLAALRSGTAFSRGRPPITA